MSTIIVWDDVPLIYVIREYAALYYAIESQPDYDLEQLSIDCVPLAGLIYKIDARKVHQVIHGCVQGETAEMLISPKERKQDVRLDYLDLLAYYGGKGNKVVRVKESEALWTLLI